MRILAFDIETIPLDDAALALVEPEFEAPANYKDAEKIAAAKAEKRAAWKEKAALSPLTGRVAMIGTHDGAPHIHSLTADAMSNPAAADNGEQQMLAHWWEGVAYVQAAGSILAGWNSHRFDIPFLVRRSWSLGVPVPRSVLGRLALPWVDLMQVFTLHTPGEYVSLDAAARFLGCGAKSGNCLDVARQLREEPAKAVAYLENDLAITRAIALKLGLETWGPPVPPQPALCY